MRGHACPGFRHVDAARFPRARVLLLCGTPSPTRRRHSVVSGTANHIQAVERSAVSGAAGVWCGVVGLASVWGFPRAWSLRGMWSSGEHTHVLETSARVEPQAAGHIHDPLLLVSTRMSQRPGCRRQKFTPTAYTGPTSCLRCDKQFQSWDRRQNRLCDVCRQTIAEQPYDEPAYFIAPRGHASRASDDS
jgi:hypothetical protein